MQGRIVSECKCCGHKTIAYQRSIHPEMVSFLRKLYAAGGEADSRDLIGGTKASTDSSYLVHWGLLHRVTTGRYRLTEKGRAFVEGLVQVPRWVELVNNEPIGWSPQMVRISSI